MPSQNRFDAMNPDRDVWADFFPMPVKPPQRKERLPRYEYAVVLVNVDGDGIDSHFYDTLAEARKDAPSFIDDECVGVVIERITLSCGHRVLVDTKGIVTPEWFKD
jgi:hypothetical protein